jgi:hypothetical protein
MTVYDLKNTIEKMSGKRAYVDAILRATGLSDIYTQDLDENPEFVRERKSAGGNLKAMQTKYDGKCAGCGGEIKAGDDIMYQHGNKEKGIKALVYHPGCVGKTPPETSEDNGGKKADIDEGAPATDKQIAVIEKLISKRDDDAQAWWGTVKKEYREALTQGRAGKIIQQLGSMAPDATIPESEWNAILSGAQS